MTLSGSTAFTPRSWDLMVAMACLGVKCMCIHVYGTTTTDFISLGPAKQFSHQISRLLFSHWNKRHHRLKDFQVPRVRRKKVKAKVHVDARARLGISGPTSRSMCS